MKKWKLNKNVMHNGKVYHKDTEISESDDGFKVIVQAGHADEVGGHQVEEKEVAQESFAGIPEEQPEQSAKPVKRSKK